jgi:hypothetical protein
MLWAYPPDFRGDYRREMLVVFRTGARDVMQREGSAALLPFMRHVSWDWLYTVTREDDYDDQHARASMGCRTSVGDSRGSRGDEA